MKKVLVLSPTSRERSQLPTIAEKIDCEIIFDDFDNDYFDDFLGENPDLSRPVLDIVALIEATIAKYQDAGLAGVTSAVGYPGMSAASVIAERLGLPGAPPQAVMICEHKYYSRVFQSEYVPEACPEFNLIDPEEPETQSSELKFPCFLKPVKSCMSKNAYIVENQKQLDTLLKSALLPIQFIEPFNAMVRAYTSMTQDATCLLQEGLLSGTQVSLEGYVFDKQAHVMGVVDAIMFPGTMSFKRWQYPSALPQGVLDRMIAIATKFMQGINYDNALFNMELFYNSAIDRIDIIEINPKIASQFPNLFEKVDGFNTYQTLLEVAVGNEPAITSGAGDYNVAASCVLRTFEDQYVVATPTDAELAAVIAKFPTTRIQIYAHAGHKLSEQVQDASSYRYGLIDLGAQSEEELEAKFEQCKAMLTFDFEAVKATTLKLK